MLAGHHCHSETFPASSLPHLNFLAAQHYQIDISEAEIYAYLVCHTIANPFS